jgi:uncharacterized damage-inducible protein DinB
MDTESIRVLYDYHCWATRRVLDAAARCTREQLIADRGAPHGSLLATLVHALAAERVWLQRIREGALQADLADLERVMTIEALREAWESLEADARTYLADLSDGQLAGRFRYVLSRAAWRDQSLWQALAYIILHGVQHRSEAAMLLTEYGESPGNLDFIIYVWELGGPGHESR